MLVRISTVSLMFGWINDKIIVLVLIYSLYMCWCFVTRDTAVTFSPVAHLWPGLHTICRDFQGISMQNTQLISKPVRVKYSRD